MQELIENVIKWAEDKNLLHPENSPKQYLKIMEECGETCRAILKDDKDGQKDGLGDIMVTLIIYGKQHHVEINLDTVTGKKSSENLKPTAWVFYFIETLQGANDSLDDTFKALKGLCEVLSFTPEECLQAAWERRK